MIIEKIFSACLIAIMICMVGLLTSAAASVRYRGLDLWTITIWGVIKGDGDFKRWLIKNYVYWMFCLVSTMLCINILSLAESFTQGHILVRPRLALIASVPLWIGIFIYSKWFIKKLKHCN